MGDRFRLHPLARAWLDAEDLDRMPAVAATGSSWDAFVVDKMCLDGVVDVGGVMVDRALFAQRWACVPDRCAPRPGRGRWRSCCADAVVGLTAAEKERLARHGAAVERIGGCRVQLDASGAFVAQVEDRCAFARIDGAGAIRCALRRVAADLHLDRSLLQPIACRVFPLVLFALGPETVVVTVLNRRNHRRLGACAPTRYPCLADATLPLLCEAMAADLDWLFGAGFAAALRRRARRSR
ncbi:MAG: hypothetical protein JXR83_11560 [Deltaproteobacteria bacterium]|nr:hypothetical protein [Deltaproteobacteria bacterium]